jgi:hypothetical protein
LHGEYLVIGNKGALSRKPVEIFKLDKKIITVEFIKNMCSFATYNDYKRWLAELDSNSKRDPWMDFVEAQYPASLRQVVGNCASESTRAALYGILALKRLQNEESTQPHKLKELQRIYLKMLQFFKIRAFEDFLKVYLCEYHQLSPHKIGERQKYIEFIQRAIGEISQFPPDVFSENLRSINTLLSSINLKTNE